MLLLVAALPTTADLELEVPGWRGSLPLLVGEGFPLGPQEICSPGLIERRLALQEESHHIHITFPSQLVGRSAREHEFLAKMEPRKGQGTPVCISKERDPFCCR